VPLVSFFPFLPSQFRHGLSPSPLEPGARAFPPFFFRPSPSPIPASVPVVHFLSPLLANQIINREGAGTPSLLFQLFSPPPGPFSVLLLAPKTATVGRFFPSACPFFFSAAQLPIDTQKAVFSPLLAVGRNAASFPQRAPFPFLRPARKQD